MVATDVLDDDHAFVAAVPEPLRFVEEPAQIDSVPVITGNAFTVTFVVCEQPVLFVYVIIAVPAAIPVITPVLLTVATAIFEDCQGLDSEAVPDPTKVVVAPTHTAVVPVIVGNAFTVTEIVVVLIQPFPLAAVV